MELVEGVAINDANYPVRESITINGKTVETWKCPFYQKWKSMIKRCYNHKQLERNETYKYCYVCEEWLTFSNFKSWMETQDWEGKELDKDLLVDNNKLYSEKTCVFISHSLNSAIAVRRKKSNLKLGVHISKNKFVSQCERDCLGKKRWIGVFNTENQAHRAWVIAKLEVIDYYLSKSECEKVTRGLTRIRNKLERAIVEDLEVSYL